MFIKILLSLWLVAAALSASLSQGNREKVVDNSPFTKIWKVNQNVAKLSRSGGADYFQGDIVLTGEKKKQLLTRGGVDTGSGRFGSTIYYSIEPKLENYRGLIESALNHWREKVGCLTFLRDDRGYMYAGMLRFVDEGVGCSSAVGKQWGGNKINIQRGGCTYFGVIVHEIGHALGFWHEQSRPDRDYNVKIHWDNITPGMQYNFYKMNGISTRHPYDYYSIMHYGPNAFSKNGYATITTKNNAPIGQRYGLSTGDIAEAKAYFCQQTGK